MNISFFNREITPAIGKIIAGYAPEDISIGVHDPLYVDGLLLDSAGTRALMLAFDLLGIDEPWLDRIRTNCARKLGIDEALVILTCSHTHSGPQTRNLQPPYDADAEYLEQLVKWVDEGLDRLSDPVEVKTYYYSKNCNANINRRVVSVDCECKFLPHLMELAPFADGFCDREIGMLFFFDGRGCPVYTWVNYAAHPLCSHAAGRASYLFSADYPGALRRILKKETGSECMFTSGACGNLFPLNYQSGFGGVETMGRILADEVIFGGRNCCRENYRINEPVLRGGFMPLTVRPLQEQMQRLRLTGSELTVKLQGFAIGDDFALLGVPGELVAELGQEIKWHSPFKKTYILYDSTGYYDYIAHGHAMLEGGYEGKRRTFDVRDGLRLVNAAVDLLWQLR